MRTLGREPLFRPAWAVPDVAAIDADLAVLTLGDADGLREAGQPELHAGADAITRLGMGIVEGVSVAFDRTLAYRRWPLRAMTGRDVLAVERALRAHGYRRQDPTMTYGWLAEADVKLFQRVKGLAVDGAYGPATHLRLAPLFDSYDRWLYTHWQDPAPAASSDRDHLMHWAWSYYAMRPWAYHAVRPFILYPSGMRPSYPFDCSWLAYQIFYSAGLIGRTGYQGGGSGNTETLKQYGQRVGSAQPGDLVFYGYYGGTPPAHVAMYVGNGMTIGHGASGGPQLLPINFEPVREIRSYV